MIKNIHKWLALRLMLLCLTLSIISGSLTYYLGTQRLNKYFGVMAKEETKKYLLAFQYYLKSPSPEKFTELKEALHTAILQDNLIVIELYDNNGQKFTEVIKPSEEETEKKLPKHSKQFVKQNTMQYETVTWNNNTYLRIFLPIQDNDTAPKSGYLEGIYHVPNNLLMELKRQTGFVLILVLCVIFTISIVLYPLITRMHRTLINNAHALTLTNMGMLQVLGNAIAKRDSDTNVHNYRVTLYAAWLGEKIGLARDAMQGLLKGAFLHDVGKIGISDTILHKPGKLTDAEFEIMKTHVRHGGEIVQNHAWLQDAREVVHYHHEKFDGSGYPDGLSGEAIPLNARIFSVVDVFDALTSKRPYKEPFPLETAVEILHKSAGSHFDPNILNLFLKQVEALHAEFCNEEETVLQKKLEACVRKYF